MQVLDDRRMAALVAPVSSVRAERRARRRAALGVTGIGIVVAMVAAGRPFDIDGFWHMRDGDFILDHGTIPVHDPFSWTAGPRPWHLDSWLYDVLAATLRRAGGLGAASLASLVVVVVLTWACYARARRRGAAPGPAAWVTGAAICLLGPWIAERAQVFSYLAFVLALVVAERALKGSNRALVALAALMIVWANLHLSFSLGVGIIGLVACARGLRTRSFRRPVLVAATAVGAGAVNPYGVTAYTIGLQVRGASRFVQEWRPFDVTKPIDVLVVLFAVATLATMWRARRLRSLEVSAPVVVLLALTIDSTRMAPFLLLAAAPELALGLSWVRWPVRLATASRRSALLHGAVAGFAVVAVVAAMRMQLPRPVPDTMFPVRTAAAIPAGCRLLNEYDQGGYLIDHRWPDVLVSEDGRNDLYGEAALVAQYDVLNAQPGWQQWLDDHRVDCVLAYPYRRLVARLRALGWRVAATDPSAVLLRRPGP